MKVKNILLIVALVQKNEIKLYFKCFVWKKFLRFCRREKYKKNIYGVILTNLFKMFFLSLALSKSKNRSKIEKAFWKVFVCLKSAWGSRRLRAWYGIIKNVVFEVHLKSKEREGHTKIFRKRLSKYCLKLFGPRKKYKKIKNKSISGRTIFPVYKPTPFPVFDSVVDVVSVCDVTFI